MKHLSGLDASFLHAETPETPMHVGALVLLDPPDGGADEFHALLKTHIASRLHLNEGLTRKLELMPFELSNPVWVEDEAIDIEHHVRRVTLSRPGSFKQLEALTARLHSMPLDRSRPLWELVAIDGLESGQVAVYFKWHHAGADGQGIVAFVQTVMDTSREGREIRPPRAKLHTNRYQLGIAELAGAALSNTIAQYVKLVKTLPAMTRAVRSVVETGTGDNPKRRWRLPDAMDLVAPRTPLNVSITNQRVFAARSIPLGECKQVARQFGVSINDVVLATCSAALRRFLAGGGALPRKSLKVAVPMSLRPEGNTELNNQISMSVMTLATDIDDPVERLRAIHASSQATKTVVGNVKAALPTDFPSFVAPIVMSGLASLYGRSRLADNLPPAANLVVSNVPGPALPLYLGGGKVTAYFPLSIPMHGMALNITVESYNGSMDYGLIACRRALPDVGELADVLVEEHKALVSLAEAHATASATLPAQRKASDRRTASRAREAQPGAAAPPERSTSGTALRKRPPIRAKTHPAADGTTPEGIQDGSRGRARH